MESMFGRFWRHESTKLSLTPADPEQPRLGGSVVAKVRGFDVRTFTPFFKTYHGVYSEDYLAYGEFREGAPESDE